MKKETEVKKNLIDHFLTLNEFSGVDFLTSDNVSLANKPFKPTAGETWFQVNCVVGEPELIGNFNTNQERYIGFLQIDINTPINVGEDESEDIYLNICKLFSVGTIIGDAQIKKVYSPLATVDEDYFRKIVRINFVADIYNN